MPLICVPPGNTSPYQKGAGAVVNPASLKAKARHASIGVDASVMPGRHLQFGLLRSIKVSAETVPANTKAERRTKHDFIRITSITSSATIKVRSAPGLD